MGRHLFSWNDTVPAKSLAIARIFPAAGTGLLRVAPWAAVPRGQGVETQAEAQAAGCLPGPADRLSRVSRGRKGKLAAAGAALGSRSPGSWGGAPPSGAPPLPSRINGAAGEKGVVGRIPGVARAPGERAGPLTGSGRRSDRTPPPPAQGRP